MVRAVGFLAPRSFARVVLADIILIAASFYAAQYLTMLLDPSVFFLEEGGAVRVLPVILFMVLAMYFADLYGRTPLTSRFILLQQLSLVGGVALLSQAFVSYLNPTWVLPKFLTLAGVAISLVAIFAWRLLLTFLISRLAGAREVLILGTGETVHRIARHIGNNPELGYTVAGTLTNNPSKAVDPVLGTIDDLKEVAIRIKPQLIVAGFGDSRDRMPIADMLDLRFGGATIEEAGAAYETICRRISARDLLPSRTLFSQDFDARNEFRFVQLLDLSIGLALLLAGAPLALLFAASFRVRSGRPVFTSQRCAGYQGRPFRSRQLRIPARGAVAAVASTLHFEAWPQLWNVVTGRMSMVGPRPERLGMAMELERLLPVYDYRQNVRPGITGWAQLHRPPGEETIDSLDEVEYDLYYVKNQALSLYAFILLHGLKRRTGVVPAMPY